MKLLHLSIITAGVVSLASCSDEQLIKTEPIVPGTQVSFSLALDNNTRTYYAYPENAGGSGISADLADTKTWNLFWTNGDKVNIFSPDLGSKASPYKITVPAQSAENPSGQAYANGITSINPNGIQWGDAQPSEKPVKFYSVFPESYKISFGPNGRVVSNTMDKTNDETAPAKADLHIRRNQIVMFTKTDTHKTARIGMPIDRASNTEPEDCQNNPDAIMYAQTKFEGSTDNVVNLQYKPISTVLHIRIHDITGGKAEQNTGTETTVVDTTATVYGFRITAPTGVQLCGDFTATFNADCSTPPTYTYTRTDGDNEIYVSTIDDISGEYLQVSTKDTRAVEFNVFIVPQNLNETNKQSVEGWQIEIETDYGDFTSTLSLGNGDDADGTLKSGQIHMIPLADVDLRQGKYELNEPSWMSEIPDEVYVTELTIPGAWYALQDTYQGAPDGGLSISNLFAKGVRAFNSENRSNSEVTDLALNPANYKVGLPSSVVISGKGSAYTSSLAAPNNGKGYRVNLSQSWNNSEYSIGWLIGEILTALQSNPREFAVLTFSYAYGGEGGYRPVDYAYWLQGLYAAYNNLSATQKSLIYGSDGKIFSENTTVGDVRGKLILKVNVDPRITLGSDLLAGKTNATSTGFYQNNLPAVFSNTSVEWINDENTPGVPEDQENLPLMSHTNWMTWADSDAVNITTITWDNLGESLSHPQLHWAYSNGNRTLQGDRKPSTDGKPTGQDSIPTAKERMNAIQSLVKFSNQVYSAGNHNVWFFIGAGGIRAENLSEYSPKNEDAAHFACRFNPWLYDVIDNKIKDKNPSPLGLVFCNYIASTANSSGDTSDLTVTSYDGNQLIKIILKMNNLFYLQRDPYWTPTGSGTSSQSIKSASPNHSSGYNVAPASSGGWTAI